MRTPYAPLFALILLGVGCNTAPTQMINVPKYTEPMTIESRDIKTVNTQGFYVVPANRTTKVPGVVVIHEWWGLNDQIKAEAEKLAREGYAVFAIDLYDGEVASSSQRAGVLAGAVRANPDKALAKLRSALEFLATQPEVDPQRLAGLGWCFGGGMSGLLGTTGDPRLRATVIYYGTPVTDPAALAKMKQPVLGIWGAEDQSISVTSVRAFETALRDQGTAVQFHVYEGAGHAFANPTRGDAYRPEATADAWEKTVDFLKKNL